MREELLRLEAATESALALLVDSPAFRADAKEAWFLALAAHQLAGRADSARAALGAARSKSLQVQSELSAQGTAEGARLAAELGAAFDELEGALLAGLPPLPTGGPGPRVVRVAEGSYELPCATCGAVAVRLRLERGRLLFQGIVYQAVLNPRHAPALFAALDAGELARLHERFKQDTDHFEGIDAFCPPCDRIYCGAHYAKREVFDEGFYDCTHGTCPEGHTRIIDD